MTDHASRAHARFGASSAHRWFACPGSVALTKGMPDRPSPAALEGTRAHELLEALLVNAYPNGSDAEQNQKRAEERWRAAPQDMRDAVHVCVDYVKDVLADHPDAVLLVEQRFEIPVAIAPGEVFGTCDVCIFVPSMRSLYVVDYKHGAGVYVEVCGNKQARFYGLGALADISQEQLGYGGSGELMKIDTVCLTIVQPRCSVGDAVREEWLPVEELLEFGPVIGEAIARCKAPDAPLVPGEEQCRFCAARAVCPAREAQALAAVGEQFGDVVHVEPGALQVPAVMTGDRLGDVLTAARGIRKWFDDLEEEAERRIRAGERVKDHKLVEAQARRQWNSDDVEQIAWDLAAVVTVGGGTYSPSKFKTEKLKTFAEIEAVLKDGVDRKEARRRLDAMAYLTTKKSSGALKLAPESDPRPAVGAGEKFDGVALIPHVKETT